MTIGDGLPSVLKSEFHGAFLEPLERCGVLKARPGAADMPDPIEGALGHSLLGSDWAPLMYRLQSEGWELASLDGDYWADGTPVRPLMLSEGVWALELNPTTP